ncbi:hypothetical protein SEVIR_9G238700v4 [Setaria viridis]|uniref:Uncharacterized protein n=3 Tax=Setaria TaxID=4554 RepID=A0A368SLP3_SETIT|nr:uncharacterized protein LOC101754485 [Setaria italica]XP_034572627.1 uncharacterized protein LOC117837151 [Setaria viridis]RCV42720.1 hypothetical protein SETIT_9G238700v2 [Setaria italica]TKV93630.1 hypothetical protein SEVIR_9G238700v2 [Setaria viridis]
MEQPEISFCSPEMEQTGLFWLPVEEAEQGLDGLLGDLQLSLASSTACGLQMENYRARDDDAVLILKLLEEPRDEADLDEWLSGGLHESPLQDTVSHHQMECRRSGRRGTRKRRTSPWDTLFFGGIPLRRAGKYITRKNNSHWTAKEVKLLVHGVSKFGVGRWSKLKKKYFKTSVRTAVNLKDKWRNLLRAYQKNIQKYTLLDLEPPLVEQIRKLAVKHPYPKRRHS